MNNDAYDRIIDRYLTGQMKPEEEREFQELLKLDPDLNALFSADAIVGRVLTNDKETLPAERPEAYAHFLGLLATGVPAAQQMASSNSATTSATKTAAVGKGAAGAGAVGKGSILGPLLAGGAVKMIVGAVAVIGVAAGSYFGIPALRSGAQQPASQQQIKKVPEISPNLHGTDLPTETAAPAAAPTTEVPAPALRQEPKVEAEGEASRRATIHTVHENQTQVQTAPLVGAPSTAVTAPADRPEAQRQLPKPLIRLQNDTVRTQVKLKSNGKSVD